jgi:hypothetical protein
MFGGKAPLRLAAQRSRPNAPLVHMRSALAYSLCKWGVKNRLDQRYMHPLVFALSGKIAQVDTYISPFECPIYTHPLRYPNPGHEPNSPSQQAVFNSRALSKALGGGGHSLHCRTLLGAHCGALCSAYCDALCGALCASAAADC